jgi:hypothetical protein
VIVFSTLKERKELQKRDNGNALSKNSRFGVPLAGTVLGE